MDKTPLEKLIKSLNRGELKSFNFSIKNTTTIYVNIFKQILNEKKLTDYKNAENTQHRKYLYDSILELLSKRVNTIDSKILKKILHTEVLYKRQLIKEAWKEANKAQKLAQKHERFGFFIQILEWKKNIGFYLDNFTQQDYFDLSKLGEQVLNLQMKYLHTKDLYMEILSLKRKTGYLAIDYDKNKFLKFDIDIDDYSVAPSQRTLFYARMTKAIYYWMLKEHKQGYRLTKLNTQEVDIKVDNAEYLIAHLEHLTSCVCIGAFNEIISILKSLKEKYNYGFFGNNSSAKLKIFLYAANYEIMSYVYTANYKKLKQKLDEVNKGIIFWDKNISKEMLLMISTAQRLGYYILGDYKKARFFTNKILNEPFKIVRIDVFNNTLLFNLITVFDKHNYDYQEIVLLKTLKHYKNTNIDESFAYVFASLLQKHILDDCIFQKTYDELKPQLHKYFSKLDNGNYYSENYLIEYIWLISKVKKINMSEAMIQWYNNKI